LPVATGTTESGDRDVEEFGNLRQRIECVLVL
jgi:hypothetical protein